MLFVTRLEYSFLEKNINEIDIEVELMKHCTEYLLVKET